MLGDSAMGKPRTLELEAYDRRGVAERMVPTAVRVADSSIASAGGTVILPRSRGITMVTAHACGRSVSMGLHVYQRFDSLSVLDSLPQIPPRMRLLAIPLRLERGEIRRQRIPPGGWMLTMLPEQDTVAGRIRLRVEGASCTATS